MHFKVIGLLFARLNSSVFPVPQESTFLIADSGSNPWNRDIC